MNIQRTGSRLPLMLRSAALAIGCGLMTPAATAQPAPPTIETAQGPVVGVAVDPATVAFKGIPYAAPPVGPLRWKPPAPAPHWSAPRDATHFGSPCPQSAIGNGGGGGARNTVPGTPSEDCLTLNVWAPASRAHPLPVMVWIHGGAHRIGSGAAPFYDGAAFARDGVILVTLNYRLGLLGYFAHPALTAEAGPDAPLANYGTMDQIAALRWVRDNIAGFGGDPHNVTVFGESAGGVASLLMLTVPEARGLFDKAIVESGGGWNAMPDLAASERAGIAATGLGATTTAEQLRALPVSALSTIKAGVGFGPVIDGRLVHESIASAFAAGRAAAVPLIIGTNSDEGSLMESFGMPPEQVLAPFPQPARDALHREYGDRAPDDAALARRLFGDGAFGAPARWVAQAAAKRAPVWLYRFDYVPDVLRDRRNGVVHGGEIPFVFDSWKAMPMLDGLLTAVDRAEVATVHGCWIAFARTGTPSCTGAPAWPAYSAANAATMNFAAENTVVQNLDKAAYDMLERILLPRALAPAGAVTSGETGKEK